MSHDAKSFPHVKWIHHLAFDVSRNHLKSQEALDNIGKELHGDPVLFEIGGNDLPSLLTSSASAQMETTSTTRSSELKARTPSLQECATQIMESGIIAGGEVAVEGRTAGPSKTSSGAVVLSEAQTKNRKRSV